MSRLNDIRHLCRSQCNYLDIIDLKELQELKERLAKVDDKERQIVKAEIREEEKRSESKK